MARIETITMSTREIGRIKTIQAVVEDNLKPMVTAIRLSLTTRQIQRLVIWYRNEGIAGLTSRQRGHTGNRQLAPRLADDVLTIIRERYADFGPNLACEKLCEIQGIVVSKETSSLTGTTSPISPRSSLLILATTRPRTAAKVRPSSQVVNSGRCLIDSANWQYPE